MKLTVLTALLLTLTACASSGPKIEAAQLNELQAGRTTVAEVVKRFGRPSVHSKNMDGTQTAAYLFAKDRSQASALVPFAGALAGKEDADVDSVIFSFDDKGVLRGYKSTHAAVAEPVQPNAQTAAAISVGDAKPGERPEQPQKKAAARAAKPWTLQSLQPVGQVENR